MTRNDAAATAPDIGRRLVALWFTLDVVLCLFPPLYWLADGRTQPVLGVPLALVYFLAVSACTAASVVFAAYIDETNGEVAR